jgi:hypothetical protein
MTQDEQQEILRMIQNGTISAEEGAALLETLEETHPELLFASHNAVQRPDQQASQQVPKWKRWWVIPFWTGVAVTVLSSWLIYAAWDARGLGLLFFFSWLPFLAGLAVLILGWNSRTGPWLHIQIRQAPGEKPRQIDINLPIPIQFAGWLLEMFGHFIPGLKAAGLMEIKTYLKTDQLQKQPLHIEINDAECGEQVTLIIG